MAGYRSKALCAALATTAAAMHAPVTAAEWSIAPTLSSSFDYDSNRQLAADPTPGQGRSVRFDAQLHRATATTRLALHPYAELQRYTNDSAFDSDNRAIEASGAWLRDHDQLEASAQYANENALTSELTESGFVSAEARRETQSVSAVWRHQQSAHYQLDVQAGFEDVRYADDPSRLLVGYRYPNASISERVLLSPRTSVAVTAFASRLTPRSGNAESENTGAQLSLTRVLTEQMSLVVSLGFSQRSIGGTRDEGYIGGLELQRTNPLGEWRLALERSTSASGFGVLVVRDEAGITLRHALRPRVGARFSIQGVSSREIGTAAVSVRRRYGSAGFGIEWASSPTWTLGFSGSYSLAQQSRDADVNDGWSTSVSLTWRPNRFMVSR